MTLESSNLFANKTIVDPLLNREEQTSFLQQDLVECLVVVPQDVSSKPILNLLIEEVLFGWCRRQLFCIHGSWVYEISWSPLHVQFDRRFSTEVTCAFLTVAALRINWARVICARVVWSRFSEAVSTRAKRNFLNNRTPISARFGHGVCGPVGILFTLCVRQNACMS